MRNGTSLSRARLRRYLNVHLSVDTRASTCGRRLPITVSKGGRPGTSGPSHWAHVSPT